MTSPTEQAREIEDIHRRLAEFLEEEDRLLTRLDVLGDKTYEVTDEMVERTRAKINLAVENSRLREQVAALTTAAAAGRECVRGHRYGPYDSLCRMCALEDANDTLRSQLAGAKREIETWKMHAYDHGYQP